MSFTNSNEELNIDEKNAPQDHDEPSEHHFDPDVNEKGLSKKKTAIAVASVVAIFILIISWPFLFPGKKKADSGAINDRLKYSSLDTENAPKPNSNLFRSTETFNEEQNNPNQQMPSGNHFASQANAQTQQPPVFDQPSSQSTNSNQSSSMHASNSNAAGPPPPYKPDRSISRRFDDSYRKMVEHFKSVSEAGVGMSADQYGKFRGSLSPSVSQAVEPQLQNLVENPSYTSQKYHLASGATISATTEQTLSSDHPGYFTAIISSPSELAGYKLLCQSLANVNDRLPITVNKIVSPDGSWESQLKAEARMQYPGLQGQVTSHYIKRLVPPVLSAAVGASAGYLYYTQIASSQKPDSAGQRINTADAVAGLPYQQGIQGIQNEIMRFGGDNPNTVAIPQGTEFEILIQDPLDVSSKGGK